MEDKLYVVTIENRIQVVYGNNVYRYRAFEKYPSEGIVKHIFEKIGVDFTSKATKKQKEINAIIIEFDEGIANARAYNYYDILSVNSYRLMKSWFQDEITIDPNLIPRLAIRKQR
jgi:hypothetical protein